MLSPHVLERHLEAKIVDYAKRRGCLVYKFSSPSHRGVADRIIISPFGVVWFLEAKAPGQTPTALQHKFIEDVKRNNGNASWVDSVEAGKSLIDGLTLLT